MKEIVLAVAARQRPLVSALACVVATTVACTGYITGVAPGSAAPASGAGGLAAASVGAGGTGGSGEVMPPAALPPFEPAVAVLPRLTEAQYGNAMRDLFGSGLKLSAVEPDTRPYLFSVIGASMTTLSEHGVELYGQAAYAIAAQVFADTARRQTIVPCPVTTPLADACLTSFIRTFGLRAWRRPLDDAEIQRYRTVAAQTGAGDSWRALRFVTSAMLQSPFFLYRTELGEPSPEMPARLRYTGYEVASRISFLLRNSIPDAELLAAAASGELVTREGIVRQATRLLQDSLPTEAVIGQLFTEYWDLSRLAEVAFPPAMNPRGTLADSMQREILTLVNRIGLEEGADLRTLFTTRRTAVNADLAAFYELPVPAGGLFAPADLPAAGPRAGLLTTPGFLALNNRPDRTSPTLRGLFVRERLLCGQVPEPPASADLKGIDADMTPTTLRQKLEQHRSNVACRGCHQAMDPLGLGMEDFDHYGQHRTNYADGAPVDAGGDLDGIAFTGAQALGGLLAADQRFADCMVKQLYRYGSARLDEPGEAEVLATLNQGFARSGFQLKPLLVELLASDGFRYLKVEAP